MSSISTCIWWVVGNKKGFSFIGPGPLNTRMEKRT